MSRTRTKIVRREFIARRWSIQKRLLCYARRRGSLAIQGDEQTFKLGVEEHADTAIHQRGARVGVPIQGPLVPIATLLEPMASGSRRDGMTEVVHLDALAMQLTIACFARGQSRWE